MEITGDLFQLTPDGHSPFNSKELTTAPSRLIICFHHSNAIALLFITLVVNSFYVKRQWPFNLKMSKNLNQYQPKSLQTTDIFHINHRKVQFEQLICAMDLNTEALHSDSPLLSHPDRHEITHKLSLLMLPTKRFCKLSNYRSYCYGKTTFSS